MVAGGFEEPAMLTLRGHGLVSTGVLHEHRGRVGVVGVACRVFSRSEGGAIFSERNMNAMYVRAANTSNWCPCWVIFAVRSYVTCILRVCDYCNLHV